MTVRGLARSAAPPPEEILLVMVSGLRDAIYTLPVIHALKRTWPDCDIACQVQPLPLALLRGHPCIDRFLPFHRRPGLRAWESFQEAALRHPARPYDLVLALQAHAKAGLLTALAPARAKLGFDPARAHFLSRLFTDEQIDPRGQRHVQDEYFEFLEYLGIDPHPGVWDLALTDRELEEQAAFFGELDRPACAVAVATDKPQKNWHARGYAAVLEELENRWNLQPLLVGGSARIERRVADQVMALTRARPLDCLCDDPRRLAWLIAGSLLTISPDSGPLHVSRALHTPVVSLYGYTNPKRTGPYRRYQDLVVDGYAEFPGEAYPVSSAHRDGMKRVTVEKVLNAIELALQKYVTF